MSEGLKKIHARIAVGGAILNLAFFAWIYLLDGLSYFVAGRR